MRVAGADRAAVGRGCWHDGDRASGRQIQARGLAVAGTVRRRRRGFVAEGVDGWLRARPRSGRPPMVGPDQVRAVVERTVPPDATHWSTRSLARAVGLGKTTTQKIWREPGLKPHLIKGFKVSRDPAFVDKVRDVVGLYINPPDHAVVLSVDESEAWKPRAEPRSRRWSAPSNHCR